MNRRVIDTVGGVFLGKSGKVQKQKTEEIGGVLASELIGAYKGSKLLEEKPYKDGITDQQRAEEIFSGEKAHIFSPAMIMPMDMDFAHIAGYPPESTTIYHEGKFDKWITTGSPGMYPGTMPSQPVKITVEGVYYYDRKEAPAPENKGVLVDVTHERPNQVWVELNTHTAGLGNYEKLLKVMRFENDTFTILAEHSAGIKTSAYTEPWFVYQKKIFIYKDSTTKLEVYDENFIPTTHPLAEAFNQNSKNFRQLFEMAIHPTLPIALMVETGKNVDWKYLESLPMEMYEKVSTPLLDESARRTLFLFRWEHPNSKQRIIPLVSIAGSIWNSYNPKNAFDNFSFSQDGKWVTFRDYSNDGKNPVFVAVPIDEKLPFYLGKPIKLGNAMREDAIEPKSVTWTTKPTAFIMCDGMVIYRWDLDRYKQLSMQKVKMPSGAADPFK